MRSFILEKTNKRFQGDKVLDVAKKASKYLFQIQNNKKSIVFCIKETTKGSKNKSYKYKAIKKESIINIKKYMGGLPKDELYKIGDIVTLYDRRANGYLTYNKEKYEYQSKYTLKMNKYDIFVSVYYNDNLIAENDINKISYWKIVDKIKIENIHAPFYKYIFQLVNNNNPLFLKFTEESSGPYNKTLYFELSSNYTNNRNGFEINNDMLDGSLLNSSLSRERFLIDVRHKIPTIKQLSLRESKYNYKHF